MNRLKIMIVSHTRSCTSMIWNNVLTIQLIFRQSESNAIWTKQFVTVNRKYIFFRIIIKTAGLNDYMWRMRFFNTFDGHLFVIWWKFSNNKSYLSNSASLSIEKCLLLTRICSLTYWFNSRCMHVVALKGFEEKFHRLDNLCVLKLELMNMLTFHDFNNK